MCKAMNELISVIIPVYKVEAYLVACVESVLAQTYSNIEIILVDDGSPDNSPRMCDEFAARDSRIRVIHKANGGLSSARNTGMDAARGELLAFLDSDDLWTPLFLERLHTALTEVDADFAVCLFRRFRGEPPQDLPVSAETEVLTQREAFECLFNNRNESMVVAPNKLYRTKIFGTTNKNMLVSWNKLYQSRLFDTIRYPVGKLHEDESVIHEIIGAADKVAWIDEAHYLYRESPNSITTAKFNLKRLDETFAKEQRIAYLESRGMQDLADRTKIVYLSNLMRLYRSVQSQIEDEPIKKQALQQLHRRFCEIHNTALVRDCSAKARLRYTMFKLCPALFSALDNARLKRKGIV